MLPIADCQSPMCGLTHRYRGQAPSHIWFDVVSGAELLALALGPSHVRPAIFFQMLNDDPRHILAGGGLDPFQAR